MPSLNRTCRFALPLTVLLAALTVAGCKGAEQPVTAASLAPVGKPGVTITAARLVLPAVPGNPGAAYFALGNQSKGTVAITGVAVAGAGKTEIHTPDMKMVDRAEAEAGTTLTFEPGKVHVMVYDVAPSLKPGSKAELTVMFADGDKLAVQAKVEGAGAAAMAGMDGMASMGSKSEAPHR